MQFLQHPIQTLSRRLNGSQIIALTFFLLIGAGTLLLMLPAASASGQGMPFIDALFTATSAACVTGLTVVDTGTHFTSFGHTVILLLIQIGGLGIMAITTLVSLAMGKKINLRQRRIIQESINSYESGGVVRLMKRVLLYTIVLEGIFGTVLGLYLVQTQGLYGMYLGYWTSVSAFCNAGFDIIGNHNSLLGFQTDWGVNLIVMMLINLGGIGFTVIYELIHVRTWKKYSLHTKIVLIVNNVLIVVGAIAFWLLEHHNPTTIGTLSLADQWLASFFQSVSARTAGFNTIELSNLHVSTLFLISFLMFIGASPTSTGGGLKTTTFMILLTSTWCLLRGHKDVNLFHRRIDWELINRSYIIFTLMTMWIVIAFLALLIIDGGRHDSAKILFELISSFGTVGLGVGITADWDILGKIVLITTMFIGRVGIITFVLSFMDQKSNLVRYPAENLMIG